MEEEIEIHPLLLKAIKEHTFNVDIEKEGNAREPIEAINIFQKVKHFKDAKPFCPSELSDEIREMIRKKQDDDKFK